jgi:flagellar secretion chaperone FliS
MATINPFGAYLESKILSASPLELVSLAYEGAIEAVRDARVCLAEKRIHDRSRAITKAQLILTELQHSLDFTHGGDLSVQLARLYDYMQRRLIDANFQQAEPPLVEVENLLETVRESWKELAQQQKPMVAAAAAPSSSSWMTSSEPVAYSRAELTL